MSGNPNVSPFTGIDGQDSPGYHAVVAGIDNTGKVQALKVDSDGALAITGAGSGGTSMTDDSAFTPGTSAITPAGGTYRSVRDSLDDNDGGAFAMTQKRALLTAIETPNGDSAMDDTNDALRVNVVAGSTAGTEYTEDAAAAANPVGTAQILIRSDTPAAQVTTDGDNVAQRGTNYGAAYVQVVSSSGAFVDTFGGGTQYTEGDTDATITGTAMLMEGAGDTLVPAQGTAADGLLVNLGANNDVTVAGVSTAANQATIIGHVDGIEGLLTTIDADTDNISTKINTLAGAVSGSEMQVDVVGALPVGNNNIGDVDVATLPAVHFQDVHVTGQGSQTALNQNVVLASAGSGSYDTLNGTTGISFRSVSLTIVPAAGTVTAGVISFEGSNDNTNFVATFLTDSANVTAVPVSTVTIAASTNRHFFGAIPFRYFRARISTGITGTTTGVQCFSVFSTVPFSSPRLAVTNATAASLLAQVSAASGAFASGSIAAGAITAGATSIATTEDTASAAGDHLVKVAQIRLDTPVSGANASASGDYIQFIADSFGKTWTAGAYPEDIAHIAGEPILGNGARRIDTAASSAGTSGDWATVDASAEGALWVTATPTTTSGLSVANFNTGDTYTALTNTAQVIKASAGNLYGYYIFNPNTSTAYVMVYNVAAASVTVGTTTALMVFAIPAGAAANLMFPYPISFSTAMSCAAATTGGGNTAPATALEVMIWYK